MYNPKLPNMQTVLLPTVYVYPKTSLGHSLLEF